MSLQEDKKRLIENLKALGYLKTQKVIKAFGQTPREEFIPLKYRDEAYSDTPLPIGYGQTISAPHMVAIMTELLEPEKTDKVLEIGAGSGYQAAVLSRLVRKIITVEFQPELAGMAEENLKRTGCKNVKVVCGDGSRGWPKEKPYDKIIVTCACPEIPKPLEEQLKEGGILILPLGEGWQQELIVARKTRGKLEEKDYGGVVFVPLRHYMNK